MARWIVASGARAEGAVMTKLKSAMWGRPSRGYGSYRVAHHWHPLYDVGESWQSVCGLMTVALVIHRQGHGVPRCRRCATSATKSS